MRVATILAIKGSTVATIDPSANVADAIDELRLRGVGALVVSRDGITIDGIVSERSVLCRIAERGERALHDDVTEVMLVNGPECSPDDAVAEVMATMTAQRVRHVPVTSLGILAGIVSIGDVVKSRVDELEAERQHLHDYVTTGR